MPLSASELEARLAPRKIQFYESVNSTNDIALEWLQSGAPSGAAVIADEQLRGRGRMGRTWYTPPESALVVSVILRPPDRTLHQITMLGALAIYDMIESLGAADLGIKWPNDVRLNKRKVSGVLPEAVWDGDQLRGVVLGMGVNVSIDFRTTDLAHSAISINQALGRTFDRVDLLDRLLRRIDHWSSRMGTQTLFDSWKNRLVNIGQTVIVQKGDLPLRGTAEAVDTFGALIVRDQHGTIHRVTAGDVLLTSDEDHP